MNDNILLDVRNLKKHFPIRQGLLQKTVGYVKAVDGISFTLERGKVLGIVGESGCGKSTAARVIMDLIPPSEGEVLFEGHDMYTKDRNVRRDLRRRMNIVFQDPFNSLNPRMTVAQLVGEPLLAHRLVHSRRDMVLRAVDLIESCGLFGDQIYRYPHQFSGGQRQRICIARALASEPDFIVCDEAVSALDVSIQAQIINLLCDLREQRGLTYIFISHDLNVVRFISDEVAVMYLGQIVEKAPKETLFSNPAHPYTVALLNSVPVFSADGKRDRIVLEGDIPSPSNPPPGCRFHTRCPEACEQCRTEAPQTREIAPGHTVCCHKYTA